MNDFTNAYDRYLDAQTKANEHNKTVVFDALTFAGVANVTVSFDGEGDSGQIDGIFCEGSCAVDIDKVFVNIRNAEWGGAYTDTSATLNSGIETLCYGYLAQKYGGWENNDGGFGTFTLDAANRTIQLEFNARFTDHNTFEHSF